MLIKSIMSILIKSIMPILIKANMSMLRKANMSMLIKAIMPILIKANMSMLRKGIIPIVCRIIFLLLAIAVNRSAAGQIQVSAVLSDSQPAAGEIINVTLSVEDAIDFFSASAEISFDHDMLEFTGVTAVGLSEGGLVFAGELDAGKTGASVTRKEPLPGDAAGDFMVLSFRVKTYAFAGITELVISEMLIHNSAGEEVPAGSVSPLYVDIAASIADIRLQLPAVSETDEGELFSVEGVIFASGITDVVNMLCQVGVSGVDTDPVEWDEAVWTDMDFEGSDEDYYLRFSAEIAFMRPPGEWFIVLRSSLDGGDFVFGGINGVWHENESPGALLEIMARPPFRYALAKWDFDNESLLPSLAVPENRDAAVVLEGASLHGFVAGVSGQAANSRGWDEWADGSGYWMVEISTAGFVSLELSSRQGGSNTGPRDFALEYSLDGTEWHMTEGDGIVLGNNWSSGRVDRLPLPGILENRDRVLLRWVMTSDVSIGDGIIGAAGTSRIDDILISGINPDPQFVTVFPGDANNDGVVNADDVLPLGAWWLSSGPPAVWESVDFIPRTIEQWIPAEATFADTNGDGIVDHRDLMMVGLHFGKTTDHTKKESTEPLSELIIDPLEDDDRVKQIIVMTERETALRGVAFSVELKGIPADMWEVRNVVQEFAGEADGDGLISFVMADSNIFEAAFAFRGRGDDVLSRKLAGFELVIDERWNDVFTIALNRLTVSNSITLGERAGEGQLVYAGTVNVEESLYQQANENTLMQNFPNPFSHFTSIPFRLASASEVTLEISSVPGRILAAPLNAFRDEGLHVVLFDGSSLPPGIYFCRLLTPGRPPEVIRMVKTE